MNEIELKLDMLESIFKAVKAPILRYFNPGLQDYEINAFFSEADIPNHPDLMSLYRWHNGLISIYGAYSGLKEFLPSGTFPNLTEMAALRKDFIGYDYLEIKNRRDYIPFLSGGEDDMHLLRITSGEIYYLNPSVQIYCEPKFHSLSSMLDFILKCYDEGILRMHPIEGLLVDEKYWKTTDDYGN